MAIDGTATTIEVTPEAATKLQELRADDPKRAFLRLYVAGQSTRSLLHFCELLRLADAAGLIEEPELAMHRMKTLLAFEWVDGPEGTGFLVRNPSLGGSCACGG